MHKKVQNISKELKDVKRVTMMNTIMMAVFVIWTVAKPYTSAVVTNTANGGSVSTSLSIGNDYVSKANARGYFTAKEYADFHGINLETVYRRIESGDIIEARKVNSRWQLPIN